MMLAKSHIRIKSGKTLYDFNSILKGLNLFLCLLIIYLYSENGDNEYVVKKFEGDMDSDWGGQGSASMLSGSSCGNLGADKCASITSASNYTSAMGVPNTGTTFIQTVDISALNITYGGETNYTIKVDKQDAQDSIYMHIT